MPIMFETSATLLWFVTAPDITGSVACLTHKKTFFIPNILFLIKYKQKNRNKSIRKMQWPTKQKTIINTGHQLY